MLAKTEAYGLTFMFPENDEAVGPCLTRYGEFSRVVLDFLLEQAVEDGGALIDVGANIGSICLPFAAQRPTWNVTAIEAHRAIASILAANALTNGLHNVDVLAAAAGPGRRVVDFPNPALRDQRNWGTVSFYDKAKGPVETTPLAMVTLDEIAPPNTRLIKIDVEGFEPPVLAGAKKLITEIQPIWLVEAVYVDQRASVIETFQAAGYDVRWFYAPFVTIKSHKGEAPPDPTVGDSNVVCVPPGKSISWDLPVADAHAECWPTGSAAYPFLSRYGYSAT